MNPETLLPCPFCGSPAEWEDDLHLNCGCSGSPNCPGAQEWHPHDAWNHRPSPAVPEQPGAGPSQDSQEVREAVDTLRGFAKRWCDDGQCRNINGYSHDPECREFFNAVEAVETALLSQSPKGLAEAAKRYMQSAGHGSACRLHLAVTTNEKCSCGLQELYEVIQSPKGAAVRDEEKEEDEARERVAQVLVDLAYENEDEPTVPLEDLEDADAAGYLIAADRVLAAAKPSAPSPTTAGDVNGGAA